MWVLEWNHTDSKNEIVTHLYVYKYVGSKNVVGVLTVIGNKIGFLVQKTSSVFHGLGKYTQTSQGKKFEFFG